MAFELGGVVQDNYNLEAEYDAQILPLIKEIHAICLKLNIPMVCLFGIARDENREQIARSSMLNRTDSRRNSMLSMIIQISESDGNSNVVRVDGNSVEGMLLQTVLGMVTDNEDDEVTETKH